MGHPANVFLLAAARREAMGLSLEDIAVSSKICTRYLRAIENGNLEELPGGIYTTSYIRQYARAVEADEYELLAAAGLEPVEEPAAAGSAGLDHSRLGVRLRALAQSVIRLASRQHGAA